MKQYLPERMLLVKQVQMVAAPGLEAYAYKSSKKR
jgi:hypothetical protein